MQPRRLPPAAPVLAAAAVLTVACAGPAAAQEWDRQLWDPAGPVEGQIDVPLPCGGAMAFLRVPTPVEPENPLADHEIRIGGSDPETGYLDYIRTVHLRGAFSDGDVVYFYLAKYETTRDQWAAVMGPDCPQPSRGGSRPQGGVAWFDALDFTRRLTEWLRAEAPDALPVADGVPGHVRLPTEVEWEYAARGGSAVDLADFRSDLPPMETGIQDYAWYAGRASAGGAYRPIGMKRPNPLGLHDMLGGVEEVVLEPFRLNNLGRPHGQVGGFVTRGGSIETEAPELRTSLRQEWPFFDATTGRATAFDRFGVRPVISAPVNTSLPTTTRIRETWIDESRAEATGDPLAVLDELLARETDQRMRNELALVRSEFVDDRRERDESAARAMRLSLLNGAVVMRWLRQEVTAQRRLEAAIAGARVIADGSRRRVEETEGAERARNEGFLTQVEESIRLNEANLERTRLNVEVAASAYLTALVELAEGPAEGEVRNQANLLTIELADREQDRLAPSVDRFVQNIAERKADRTLSREAMIEQAVR